MRTRALAAAVIIAAGLGVGCGSPARPHAGRAACRTPSIGRAMGLRAALLVVGLVEEGAHATTRAYRNVPASVEDRQGALAGMSLGALPLARRDRCSTSWIMVLRFAPGLCSTPTAGHRDHAPTPCLAVHSSTRFPAAVGGQVGAVSRNAPYTRTPGGIPSW